MVKSLEPLLTLSASWNEAETDRDTKGAVDVDTVGGA